jgi:hypothetical protein
MLYRIEEILLLNVPYEHSLLTSFKRYLIQSELQFQQMLRLPCNCKKDGFDLFLKLQQNGFA